jgi:hypothetical protein
VLRIWTLSESKSIFRCFLTKSPHHIFHVGKKYSKLYEKFSSFQELKTCKIFISLLFYFWPCIIHSDSNPYSGSTGPLLNPDPPVCRTRSAGRRRSRSARRSTSRSAGRSWRRSAPPTPSARRSWRSSAPPSTGPSVRRRDMKRKRRTKNL